MGPHSEGGPSSGGRSFGAHSHSEDGGRYQSDRDINLQDDQLSRPNGAFASGNMVDASPTDSARSATSRERERDLGTPKNSGERNRSRTRSGKTGSGQLRICKKCGDPLTGQFVRALGGTFHLDCFRCRVSEPCLSMIYVH
jgi:hypothetical protein